jgi:hypothetical protein
VPRLSRYKEYFSLLFISTTLTIVIRKKSAELDNNKKNGKEEMRGETSDVIKGDIC